MSIRSNIPRAYQATYKKAMSGKSRRAAIRAFCAECCGYEIKEVYVCTDSHCPLYPYRPHSRILQSSDNSAFSGQGCETSDEKVSGKGVRL